MTSLFRLLSRWPLWLLHGIGAGLGWLVFLASGTYRRRFLDHARQAGVAWRHWLPAVGHAGKMVAELPRLWLGKPVPVQWSGQEHVAQALQQGRGLLCLTPHLGCFEITAQAYAAAFGSNGQPMTVLYRPARQPWLRTLVAQARLRPGLKTAPTTLSGVKHLIKALRAGETVGLLPDQVPPRGLGVDSVFFGRSAYTMTLSARLVQQTGAAVVLAWGERLPWGRGFRVHVQPLTQPLPDVLEDAVLVVNQAMEALIAQCPQQYLWGYARYKAPQAISGFDAGGAA
jgi:KDO2-lipid IV(A) lauroyltransferase